MTDFYHFKKIREQERDVEALINKVIYTYGGDITYQKTVAYLNLFPSSRRGDISNERYAAMAVSHYRNVVNQRSPL